MPLFTAPPTQTNLELHNGDILNVNDGGLAVHTTINTGAFEFVFRHGLALHTTINSGAAAFIEPGGFSDEATVNTGGVENVSGISDNTRINTGGVENVLLDGTQDTVIFGGPGATLNLESPLDLRGFVRDWQVGDVIDFEKTDVTGVHKKGNELTVTFDANQTATYKLAHQQHDTQFQLQPDGHGGTILALVPIIGVGHAHHDFASV